MRRRNQETHSPPSRLCLDFVVLYFLMLYLFINLETSTAYILIGRFEETCVTVLHPDANCMKHLLVP